MASSFRRRRSESWTNNEDGGSKVKPLLLGLKGTKPWTGGITLTSSGLRDLDSILGGGLPLGTCIYLQEDCWTDSLGRALVKYWCSEALAQDQHLVIPVDELDDDLGLIAPPTDASRSSHAKPRSLPTQSDVNDLLDSLPKDLHWEKAQRQQQNEPLQPPDVVLNTLREEDEESDQEVATEDAEAGLKIAWQYRTKVQQERLGHSQSTSSSSSSRPPSDVFCHSYDLSGILSAHRQWKDMSVVCKPLRSPTCGFTLFRRLWETIGLVYATAQPQVIRLLIYHADMALLSTALPLLLARIRQEELPVIVMVVDQPAMDDSHAAKVLCRSCDVVLETESFVMRAIYPPPPEFRDFQGILTIRRISTLTAAAANGGGHFCDMTTSKRPASLVYGLKRDRRKLNIQLLHIPPEDFAQGGGSVGGSGVRSGAGRNTTTPSCAGAGGGSSPLDF